MPSRTLVFDIETAAKDLAGFDEYSKELFERIFKWAKEKDTDLPDEERFRLAFSPLTAEVVAIAAVDAASGRGGVYFQSGEKKIVFEEGLIKFESGDELFLLKKFWELAAIYDEFVTFAGRTFDVPILMLRSAMLGIRPSKNLMVNRYLESQPINARHIDLKDQFSFYGAKYERLGLHFWCKAFGIPSPKIGEVEGEDVTRLFREGEYEKIARYCLGDVVATRALFQKWEQFLRF
jgi:hypothetical protein